MQSIAVQEVSGEPSRIVDYGKRFKELRKAARPKRKVIELAKELGSPYPTTVYNIERQWRVPTIPTLQQHADALGVEPWDLLAGVETEMDRVRALSRLPREEARRQWAALLLRYQESTKRSGKKPPPARPRVATKKGALRG